MYLYFSYDYRIKSDYFSEQHVQLKMYNGDALCFLGIKDWIVKYYLDKFQASKIKDI
jgi:hypothetical protein